MEEKSLTVHDSPRVPVSMFDLSPKAKVEYAAMVATTLADVIEKQHLFSLINGKKYIRAEGWATLGTMLNVLPKEDKVHELNDGSFEAWVNLVSTSTGVVVGGASALCGVDEARWKNADRYARRSMAITRATGKAYRLAFAFIPAMAGYETTPAEEMPEIYTGDNSQKKRFVSIALKAGCPDEKAALKELSDKFKGSPFSDLERKISSYLEEWAAKSV